MNKCFAFTDQKKVKRRRVKNAVENGIAIIVHTQRRAGEILSVTPTSESHAPLEGDQTTKRQEKKDPLAVPLKNLAELDHFREINLKQNQKIRKNAQNTDQGPDHELNLRSSRRLLNIPDHDQKTYRGREHAPENDHHPGRIPSVAVALAPNTVQALRKSHIALDLKKMFPARARTSKFIRIKYLKKILCINKNLFDYFVLLALPILIP